MPRFARVLGAATVTALLGAGLAVGVTTPSQAESASPTTSPTAGLEQRGLLGDVLTAVTAPLLGGTGAIGSPLSLTMPTWNLPGVSTTTTWLSNGVPIPGASESTYVPAAADAGKGIQALVTGKLLGLLPVDAVSNIVTIPLGGGGTGGGTGGNPGTDLLALLGGLGLPATAEVGQLIALTDPIWSLPGVTTTYQWLRDGLPIPGADDQFYVPSLEDAGHAISAKVTGTLLGIPGVSVLTSALNLPLPAGEPVSPASDVTIVGTKKIGTPLTLTGPTWDPAGATSKYQWLRDSTPIAGAVDKTYRLTALDFGHAISVKVTGHQEGYTDNTITSSAVTPVLGDALQFTAKPGLTGTGKVGRLLTADPGTWSGASEDGAPPTYGYQWKRDGLAIRGAVAQTYQVQQSDIGRRITVTVTATRPAYKPGTFTTSEIAVAKRVSSLQATLAKKRIAKGQKATLRLVLRATGVAKPTGVVRVLDGRRVVKVVKVRAAAHGRVTVLLAKFKPGTHRLHAVYAGTTTVAGSATKVLTLRVTKK